MRALLLAMPLLLGLPAVALAQPADPSDGLMLDAARYRSVIGVPPAPGSAALADDLAVLRWNQRTHYPAGVAHAWQFLNRNVSVFNAAVGSDLSNLAPTLFKGLPLFLKRVDAVKNVAKDSIARPRPFVGDASFKPCLPLESTYSYPSGHSTWFAAASMLLADLLPERRERLLEVGLQGGYVRAYCQVHYPSDVLAGQRLAAAITRDVIASPQWQTFKRQLRPELDKLLVPPPAGLPLLSE